jgi:HPt (histidine-containing phosphotransfer) domain-containing protein
MATRIGRADTLDRDTFENLSEELGPDALATLVGLFAERRSSVADLSDAIERRDGAAVARHAHNLKGGASTMAAPRLAGLAMALEQCGRTGAFDGAALLTQEIATEFGRVLDEMSGALAAPALA